MGRKTRKKSKWIDKAYESTNNLVFQTQDEDLIKVYNTIKSNLDECGLYGTDKYGDVTDEPGMHSGLDSDTVEQALVKLFQMGILRAHRSPTISETDVFVHFQFSPDLMEIALEHIDRARELWDMTTMYVYTPYKERPFDAPNERGAFGFWQQQYNWTPPEIPDDAVGVFHTPARSLLKMGGDGLARIFFWLTLNPSPIGMVTVDAEAISDELMIPLEQVNDALATLFRIDYLRAHRTETVHQEVAIQYQMSPSVISIKPAYIVEAKKRWKEANLTDYRSH
ncbi:MAG TPA: hypothetical protein VHL11_03180 [Phototrophicaceae bacterium]|jgi:hypothetical protein|nr:hypothetical protein [Phototrophicaceae bacterium]